MLLISTYTYQSGIGKVEPMWDELARPITYPIILDIMHKSNGIYRRCHNRVSIFLSSLCFISI